MYIATDGLNSTLVHWHLQWIHLVLVYGYCSGLLEWHWVSFLLSGFVYPCKNPEEYTRMACNNSSALISIFIYNEMSSAHACNVYHSKQHKQD